MHSYINPLILVCLAALVSVSFAQEQPVIAGDVNGPNVPSFPYIAEITDDNVNIRSGPGTNYYSSGKLNKANKVTVVGSKHSWSHIVPPAGSFSWISQQYVRIDPDNPDFGVVTGDKVRVYAGSDYKEPIHSNTVQLKLNTDDKVRLLGEQKGDYFKIAPPTGAYLWVSTKFTKPLGPVVGEVEATVETTIESPDTPGLEPVAVVPTKITVEAEKLGEYYALKKQIEAEKAKPIAQQDYTDIKKSLLEIVGNKEAGMAGRYSTFSIKQIERYETASRAGKAVQLQDAQLQQVLEGIDNARAAKLAKVPQLGRFAVTGEFQTFIAYGPGHYRIIDASGKIVCYAKPGQAAAKMDLTKFVGRKVGLIGTIQQTKAAPGALVRFTEIERLTN